MFAISKRYLLRPASRMVVRKRNSWVRGEQEATITLFRLYSLITCFIFSCVSCEQVKRLSSATTTLGRLFAYSFTSGTLTTAPMLTPQWQIKTPILGSSVSGVSRSSAGPAP